MSFTSETITETNPNLLLEPDTDLDRPWQAVVWNDPINTMVYVTHVFQKVLGFNKEDAERHMLEVHNKKKSIVASGGKEKIEHIVHQLQSYLLNATLEQSK